MEIITTAKEIHAFAQEKRKRKVRCGFVPTMGALHDGHAALVAKAKKENEVVVVSIFVNPTQFNDTDDLEKYPRTLDADKKILEDLAVDVLFCPNEEEVYPDLNREKYDLDGLDDGMEGKFRPGHFQGVVQVVMRLFDLVIPTKAYFGEKDFQQLAVIRHMSIKLGYEVDIIGCPTIRNEFGLALSSRNKRLSEDGEIVAANIYKGLKLLEISLTSGIDLLESKEAVAEFYKGINGLEVEYLELINPKTLLPATKEEKLMHACIAATVDGVRLIDNLRVK